MSIAVRVSEKVFNDAKKAGKAQSRSAAKQIDFMCRVAKAAFENPDLPVPFVAQMLESLEDKEAGRVEPFEFIRD